MQRKQLVFGPVAPNARKTRTAKQAPRTLQYGLLTKSGIHGPGTE